MATPIIRSVGTISGPGVDGQGRNDLIAGETIGLSDAEPANSGHAYFWEFEDVPIGTAPVLTGATTATPSFLIPPNHALAGSYRVRCTVDGIDTTFVVIAEPLHVTGARIPSFQETLGYNAAGNVKGWHEAMTVFMRNSDAKLSDPGPGKAGDVMTQQIWGGGRETHNSTTPLIVGAFALLPTTFALANTTVAFQFSIVAANGDTPMTTHVELFNLTDSEVVTSSVIDIVNSTTPTKYTANLVVGPSAGQIKNGGEKIYECRIYLDVPPGDPTLNTIELFQADLKVLWTVIPI
jgi:hypothetical protein